MDTGEQFYIQQDTSSQQKFKTKIRVVSVMMPVVVFVLILSLSFALFKNWQNKIEIEFLKNAVPIQYTINQTLPEKSSIKQEDLSKITDTKTNKQGYSINKKIYDTTFEIYKGDIKITPYLPMDFERLKDFWVDESNSTVYTVEYKGDELAPYEMFFKYKYDKNEISLLDISQADIYSGSKILDYNSQQNTLLISTSGGDGCGGWGTISKIKGNYSEAVIDFGGGCIDTKIPRYVTYKDGLIILYNVEGEFESDTNPIHVVKVYSLNPFNKEEKVLFAKEQIPEETDYVTEEDGEIKLKTL